MVSYRAGWEGVDDTEKIIDSDVNDNEIVKKYSGKK